MKRVAGGELSKNGRSCGHFLCGENAGIPVDNGGNGLAVVQELLSLDKYRNLALEGRLRGYDFERMTALAVRDGRVVYPKGNDHIIDAVRCAMPAREQANPYLVGGKTVSLSALVTEPVFL